MAKYATGSGGSTSPVNDNVSRATSNASNTRGGFGTSPRIPRGKTTPPQLQTILYSQEYGTYPKQAVVEQNQTYFAYFDGIGSTGPEIIDQTAYFIKYIIDDQGNPVNPEPDFAGTRDQAVGLYNLIDDYEVGKRAIVKLIEPNPLYDDIPKSSDVLTGVHKITGVGRIAPIAITETGKKTQNYIDTMSFGPLEVTNDVGIVPDLYTDVRYFGTAEGGGNPYRQPIIYESLVYNYPFGQDLEFQTLITGSSCFEVGTVNDAGAVACLRVLTGSVDTLTRIRFRVTAYVGAINPNSDWYENTFNFRIYKTTDGGVNYTQEFVSDQYWVGQDDQYWGYFTYVTPWFDDYNEDDEYVFFINTNDDSNPDTNNASDGRYVFFEGRNPGVAGTGLIVEQEIPPQTEIDEVLQVPLINGQNAIYSPYFSASINVTYYDPSGSGYTEFNSFTYLILSPSASSVFSSNLIQNVDSASLEFGFSPIRIPFGDVRPGDWIRFEHDKTRTFNIIGVGAYEDFVSGSTVFPDLVVFKIAPNIGKSNIGNILQLNHFVIYRIINDGTYVILDVNKDVPGGAYSGIIQPEYVSEQLTNNYDKIIQNLTEKEIIQ